MIDSISFIIGTTLMYSTPLIFTSLGGLISEKSGVINIGLEGFMTIGAFIGAAVGVLTHNPWLAFFCGGVSGLILSSIHAIASIHLKADQVVTGIAINFLGPGISIFLCRILFEGTTMTPPISLENKLPRPLNGLFESQSFFDIILNQYATVYIAFILVAIVWFILNKTILGLHIKALGEHPLAAETLGISVFPIRYFCVLISGFLAGLGGASLSLAIVSNFRPTLISGQGFIALAAVIFGKWNPLGALAGCLLFGASQGLVVYLGSVDMGFKVSSQILAMIPYLLTLLLLLGIVGKTTSPRSLGQPHPKNNS